MSHPFVMHLMIHMFNISMTPYMSLDQYLKPKFIHYTKYAKYAFLLLFSIFPNRKNQNVNMHMVREMDGQT